MYFKQTLCGKNLFLIAKFIYMVRFISFGGPSPNYYRAVNRISGEAIKTGLFSSVKGYTDLDLKKDKNFWSKHGNFISKNRKGYGYWLWKPYLIKKNLDEMKEGELLLYADAGCTFNNELSNDFLKKRFNLIKKEKKILGCFTCPERSYCKMDLVKYFGFEKNPLYRLKPQHAATTMLLIKTPDICKLVNEWFEIATKDNYHYLDDSRSIHRESRCFKVHRHDQSIYSLLTKKYNIMSKVSIRGSKDTFFHTPRRRNGIYITSETNFIGLDLDVANKPIKRKKFVHSSKDVKDIIKSLVVNNKLQIKENYNTLFSDISFKRAKYLHLEYKINTTNSYDFKIFNENDKILLEDIEDIKSATYTTHWNKIKNVVKQPIIPDKVKKEVKEEIQKTKNVTSILNNYLKDNKLIFMQSKTTPTESDKVGWYNKTFTDVHYGKRKKLEINYIDTNKTPKTVIFTEDEPIHIENINEIQSSIYSSF